MENIDSISKSDEKKFYLFHHSSETAFVAKELEYQENTHKYVLKSMPLFFLFQEFEPIVVIRVDGEHIKVHGGNVLKYDPTEQIIEIIVDDLKGIEQMRLYKRYPASCFVDLKERDSKKRHGAIIKDLSKYGLKIYSKAEIEMYTLVEINISFGQAMYFLDATIMSKNIIGQFNEYGLSVSGSDIQSTKELKNFLIQYQNGCVKKMDLSIFQNGIDIDHIFELDDVGSVSKKLESATAKLESILKRSRR